MRSLPANSSERGAILVHVAIALVGLTAFSALVFDYGVMMSGRRQAQNSADAAALAGAVQMAYGSLTDQAAARQAAMSVAAINGVWGSAPDITPADVTFPNPCPDSPGIAAGGDCIRVNLFRTNYQRAGGNPMPTFFGNLMGVSEQGVRATATARVLFGGVARCLLPFAIPDRWDENYPKDVPWADHMTFDTEGGTGKTKGPLTTPDVYVAPVGNNPGTGFTRESIEQGGIDYGRPMTLRLEDPQQGKLEAAAGWYRPVRLDPGQNGQADLLAAILGCSEAKIGPGTELTGENGHMSNKQIADAINEVVDRDQYAYWDDHRFGPNQGGIAGGCMNEKPAPTCTLSPRVRPIPVYDPAKWNQRNGQGGGQNILDVTKVIGIFLERPNASNEIVGRIMTYPSDLYGPGTGPTESNFIVTITLVR